MAVHFIGFRGEEYQTARKLWGVPDFFHRWWDVRAWQEIAPGDIAIFARGDENQPFNPYTFDDRAVF